MIDTKDVIRAFISIYFMMREVGKMIEIFVFRASVTVGSLKSLVDSCSILVQSLTKFVDEMNEKMEALK